MPCFYCGVRLRKSGPFQRTKDHVVPKSKGGIRTVFACLRCNQAKADMSLEEFRWLRGGVEFWGEMKARIEAEKVAWIYEFDPKQANPSPRKITPQATVRPVYTPTVDLSKIKQYARSAEVKRKRKEQGLLPVGWCPPKKPDLRGQAALPQLSGHRYCAIWR